MSRGFVLGKFMPPHAGHMRLCETAAGIVDQLTILVCWLPGDPIAGPLRLEWMRELFPGARVIGHDAVVPQAPEEHPGFWPIWRAIVTSAHPEPIDLVFAGEDYGVRLAQEVGAAFVPVPRHSNHPSATDIRSAPWSHWDVLPPPVRGHFARTICLVGAESTGKTMLAERLALYFGTDWVPEYGRAHCDRHGRDLRPDDLVAIAKRQSAAIAAARRWCDRRLFADTDALATRVWSQMLLGHVPEGVGGYPLADLYLLLEDDVPWHDDGTRYFPDAQRRRAFSELTRRALEQAGAPFVAISGDWNERFRTALDVAGRP
jgi:NadR type nicotinamide-nucleotide adenylyltransferase